MKIIVARNAEDALLKGLNLISVEGVTRGSRNGEVLYGGSVTTVYERPCERVVLWQGRDCNPFFHLYESLWMLLGRNDVASVARYAKRMETFSDDGKIFHGAYGYRWVSYFYKNQVEDIINILKVNPLDRRCVLQMWDAREDLGRQGKDVPCNVSAVVDRGVDGEVNLTVFNRSNDIIWGAYGANAVHFSVLLEYIAGKIGAPIGRYTQISINWHAYTEILNPLLNKIPPLVAAYDRCKFIPMNSGDSDFDFHLSDLIYSTDCNRLASMKNYSSQPDWFEVVFQVLRAHEIMRNYGPKSGLLSLPTEESPLYNVDWIVAAREWLQRRCKS